MFTWEIYQEITIFFFSSLFLRMFFCAHIIWTLPFSVWMQPRVVPMQGFIERSLILKPPCSLASEFYDVSVVKDMFKLEYELKILLSKCLNKLGEMFKLVNLLLWWGKRYLLSWNAHKCHKRNFNLLFVNKIKVFPRLSVYMKNF